VDKRIQEVRTIVIDWLREENYQPQEHELANDIWALKVNVEGTTLHVSQNTQCVDSIAVWGVWKISETERDLLMNHMDENERLQLMQELVLWTAANNAILFFFVRPNPPNEITEIEISSKRLFFDSLNKEKVLNALFDVRSATAAWSALVHRHAGVFLQRQRFIAPSG